MATVLRNPNSNKIKVIYFSKPQYIRKITSNKRYFNYLQNEIRGLQWYQKYSKNKNVLIKYNKNSNFFFLDIKIFKGKKNIFYKSIEENSFLISKAIDHYLKIWPNKTHVIVLKPEKQNLISHFFDFILIPAYLLYCLLRFSKFDF